MILNRQDQVKVDVRKASALVERLGGVLGFDGRRFNVCFVDDHQIRALNAAYRRKSKATDVLSFQWTPGKSPGIAMIRATTDPEGEFEGFLGDVVISAETAQRNAMAEGHGTDTEISWLILHGLLHLMGMDHETDSGEMVALEHDLRSRLGLDGKGDSPRRAAIQVPRRRSARAKASKESGELKTC